jgi:hypothetical protein
LTDMLCVELSTIIGSSPLFLFCGFHVDPFFG